MRKTFILIIAIIFGVTCGLSSHAIAGSWATPSWSQISAPPGAPVGTQCWMYGGGWGDNSWGGPWCYVKPQGAR